MKIPNADNLRKLKMLDPIIPTIEDETNGCEILIQMEDGTIGQYINEGYLKLVKKHINMTAFLKETGFTIDELPDYDKAITHAVRVCYPYVARVYCLDL